MNRTLLQGDCRLVLPTLPDKSVNCIVTSPPYFGLRDYGCDGQIGLEQTPDAYVTELVAVFHEAWRVLRDDGTLWLNLGDSYSSGGRTTTTVQTVRGDCSEEAKRSTNSRPPVIEGIKPKDLIGIPWRVAFALQADGWYLRQDIIWHKPNPMPESVTDRCTKAHEYVFLLSKSERYAYDAESICEPAVVGSCGSHFDSGKTLIHQQGRSSTKPRIEKDTRNRRSVWTINTQPCSMAHFAVMPEALVEPCVLAGCPSGGTVLDPFGGSGTVGSVAERPGRNSILIELNPAYVELQKIRTAQMGMAI